MVLLKKHKGGVYMNDIYRENLIKSFDVATLVDYLEKNNRLITDFLIKNNYEGFPGQIFDALLRETELLKKACEKMPEWKKVLEVYRENIISVKNYKNTLYFIKDNEIQSIVLDEKTRDELRDNISLYF